MALAATKSGLERIEERLAGLATKEKPRAGIAKLEEKFSAIRA